MKIATFNINNINKRIDNLAAWLPKRRRAVPEDRQARYIEAAVHP